MMLDPDVRIQYIDHTVLGITREEMAGLYLLDIVEGELPKDMAATFLATTLTLVFVALNLMRQLKTGKLFAPTYTRKSVCCLVVFVGGATLANGVFHFLHGILGYSEFPAPFAMLVEHRVFTNASNIVWGLFNFFVTIFIALSYRSSLRKFWFCLFLFIGFIFTFLMLRFVLLADYFQTHAF